MGLVLVAIGAHGIALDTESYDLPTYTHTPYCAPGAYCDPPYETGGGSTSESPTGGHIGEVAVGTILFVASMLGVLSVILVRRNRVQWR